MPDITFAALPYSDNLRLAEVVARGIPARALRELAQALGFTLSEFALIVAIPRRTLDRRVAGNERLSLGETERAVRVGRVLAKARDVFEDDGDAASWLREPLPALGDKTPLELCSTEAGAREVEHTLGRIEHGVFS